MGKWFGLFWMCGFSEVFAQGWGLDRNLWIRASYASPNRSVVPPFGLHSGLRQCGTPALRRAESPEAEASGYLEAVRTVRECPTHAMKSHEGGTRCLMKLKVWATRS